jgi:hypothetical protein
VVCLIGFYAVSLAFHYFYRAMIITMTIMSVMQTPIYNVIDVVAMWHRFVAAARPMGVPITTMDRYT